MLAADELLTTELTAGRSYGRDAAIAAGLSGDTAIRRMMDKKFMSMAGAPRCEPLGSAGSPFEKKMKTLAMRESSSWASYSLAYVGLGCLQFPGMLCP
jgi:hypothetical protein